MQLRASIFALAAVAALGACQANKDDRAGDDVPQPDATESPDDGESVSILRPDIEQVEAPPPPLKNLEVTVGFPEGGSELDDAAQAKLREILESEQIGLNGEITLGGHSDAGGSGSVNERASRARAEAVRDWLVENGIEEDRIEIIAFGEQNPVEPNALPDGSPNEEGRAANRRVEISIPVVVVESTDTDASTEAGD